MEPVHPPGKTSREAQLTQVWLYPAPPHTVLWFGISEGPLSLNPSYLTAPHSPHKPHPIPQAHPCLVYLTTDRDMWEQLSHGEKVTEPAWGQPCGAQPCPTPFSHPTRITQHMQGLQNNGAGISTPRAAPQCPGPSSPGTEDPTGALSTLGPAGTHR